MPGSQTWLYFSSIVPRGVLPGLQRPLSDPECGLGPKVSKCLLVSSGAQSRTAAGSECERNRPFLSWQSLSTQAQHLVDLLQQFGEQMNVWGKMKGPTLFGIALGS